MLRYLEFTTACDVLFVIFLVAWLFSRQVGLALVIRTCWVDAPRYIPFKWDPKAGMYLTKETYYGFIGLISILLLLASIWFYMACSVAIRVVRGLGAEDSRSDDEDEPVSPSTSATPVTPGTPGEPITPILEQVPQSVTTIEDKREKGDVRKRK